jgi:primosomal protein N'
MKGTDIMAKVYPFPDRSGWSSSITLGHTKAGQPIEVTQQELCQGFSLIGVQGAGKTSLLEPIIYQQMEQGRCLIVLVVHRGFIDNILSRMDAQVGLH